MKIPSRTTETKLLYKAISEERRTLGGYTQSGTSDAT
jgi:hypothetical protein